MTDVHNMLMGSSGAPGAKFPTVGTTLVGDITKLEVTEQRDIKTKKPKLWPSGDIMEQIVITLQTTERSADIEDDDGKRRFFVDSKGKREALQDAVRASGARLAEGGRLGIRLAGLGEAQPGLSAPKLWAFEYQAPAQTAVDSMLAGPSASMLEPSPTASSVL